MLLPAHRQRPVGVGRQGRHEEGLLRDVGGQRCKAEAEAGWPGPRTNLSPSKACLSSGHLGDWLAEGAGLWPLSDSPAEPRG